MLMDGAKDFRALKPLREKASSWSKDKAKRCQGQDMDDYVKSLEALQTLIGREAKLEDLSLQNIIDNIDKIERFAPAPLVWQEVHALSLLEKWLDTHVSEMNWPDFVTRSRPWKAEVTQFDARTPDVASFHFKKFEWKAQFSMNTLFSAIRSLILDGFEKQSVTLALAKAVASEYDNEDVVELDQQALDWRRICLSAVHGLIATLECPLSIEFTGEVTKLRACESAPGDVAHQSIWAAFRVTPWYMSRFEAYEKALVTIKEHADELENLTEQLHNLPNMAVTGPEVWDALNNALKLKCTVSAVMDEEFLKTFADPVHDHCLSIHQKAVEEASKGETLPKGFFTVSHEFGLAFPLSTAGQQLLESSSDIKTKSEEMLRSTKLSEAIIEAKGALDDKPVCDIDMKPLIDAVANASGGHVVGAAMHTDLQQFFVAISSMLGATDAKHKPVWQSLQETTPVLEKSLEQTWANIFRTYSATIGLHAALQVVNTEAGGSEAEITEMRASLVVANGLMNDLKETSAASKDEAESVRQKCIKDVIVVIEEAKAKDALIHKEAIGETSRHLYEIVTGLRPISGGDDECAVWHKMLDTKKSFNLWLKDAASFVDKDLDGLGDKGADILQAVNLDRAARSLAGEAIPEDKYTDARTVAIRCIVTTAEQELLRALKSKPSDSRAAMQPIIRKIRLAGVCPEYPAKLKEKELLPEVLWKHCISLLS